MSKIFVGSRLRRLRRENQQTQMQMAGSIGISPAYVNLLENNQRSLSVKVLVSIADAYGVDWRDLIQDTGDRLLADLQTAMQDPLFSSSHADFQELRAAVDHAPALVESFLHLYSNHTRSIERLMRSSDEPKEGDQFISTPETVVHDFFRQHSNYFSELDEYAESLREDEACDPDDVYFSLKTRLREKHSISVTITPIEQMSGALRIYNEDLQNIQLSEALDYPNRAFQLAHMLCLIELSTELGELIESIETQDQIGRVRCRVELANYFAAAFLMPYARFKTTAEDLTYDIDRVATTFGVSFEQVCHRMTTLQRQGDRGVPFFFIRVDRAGNVTKRFNASSISIAEYGGACPVWDLHGAFNNPGNVIPQFVELPDGKRFFTINRTANRPAYSLDSQARRQAVSLGCELAHVDRIGYAKSFNLDDASLYSPIGINCRICPRQACAQRAHNPLVVELSVDPSRRGDTRLES